MFYALSIIFDLIIGPTAFLANTTQFWSSMLKVGLDNKIFVDRKRGFFHNLLEQVKENDFNWYEKIKLKHYFKFFREDNFAKISFLSLHKKCL